jgi:hypothetical protein
LRRKTVCAGLARLGYRTKDRSPDEIPEHSIHSRGERTGHAASGPYGIARRRPSPTWSILLRRSVMTTPFLHEFQVIGVERHQRLKAPAKPTTTRVGQESLSNWLLQQGILSKDQVNRQEPRATRPTIRRPFMLHPIHPSIAYSRPAEPQRLTVGPVSDSEAVTPGKFVRRSRPYDSLFPARTTLPPRRCRLIRVKDRESPA